MIRIHLLEPAAVGIFYKIKSIGAWRRKSSPKYLITLIILKNQMQILHFPTRFLRHLRHFLPGPNEPTLLIWQFELLCNFVIILHGRVYLAALDLRSVYPLG